MIQTENNGFYESPFVKTVKIGAQAVLCQSRMEATQTEKYEEGDTSDWF